MKIIIFFFSFLFLFNLVSCIELKISPQEIFLNGTSNEFICENISIKTLEESNIEIKDRWAIKNFQEKDFKSHKLNSQDLGLILVYNSSKRIINQSKELICIKAKKPGFYHGLILIRIKNSSSGIGVWVNLNISENNFNSKITGKTIFFDNKKEFNYINFILFLFLLILLIELIFYLRKNIYS